jgi:hypothetical protein
MKNMYISLCKLSFTVILSLFTQSCISNTSRNAQYKQPPNSYSEFFQPMHLSLQKRADTLVKLYEKIKDSKDSDSILEQKIAFLKLFPHSFLLFDSIYGYDDEKGPQLLYYKAEDHILNLFFDLDNINEYAFIKKVVDISLNGQWDADAISYFQMGLQESLLEKPYAYYKILNSYSEEEIASFWYFFFDGPYPDNYKDLYKLVHIEMKSIDEKFAAKIKETYNSLLERTRN